MINPYKEGREDKQIRNNAINSKWLLRASKYIISANRQASSRSHHSRAGGKGFGSEEAKGPATDSSRRLTSNNLSYYDIYTQ